MPTTSQDNAANRTKTPARGEAEKRPEDNKTAAKEPRKAAKEDKDRSDWEGMTPKPEQGSDDVAAPGQLPETD